MPRLTVLMSVYNGDLFLKEAIDSVLNQTFSDFEFIIYDDCSTDNSRKIIEGYQDERIVLIKNNKNRGLTYNLHEGMNMATGEYLARMDADDICLSDRFEKQISYLDLHPEISILGTSVIFFDETGTEFIGYQPLTHDEIKVELLFGFTLLHPSVMMRLADIRKYQLNYDPYFRYSQDFDLWMRSSHLLQLANFHEPLIKMREHSKKISRALKPEQRKCSNEIRERQFMILDLNLPEEDRTILHDISSGTILFNTNKLKKLEGILILIVSMNEKKKIYNQALLLSKIHRILFSQYYECLKNKNKMGLCIWNSSFNVFTTLSIIEKTKILIFSILTHLMK